LLPDITGPQAFGAPAYIGMDSKPLAHLQQTLGAFPFDRPHVYQGERKMSMGFGSNTGFFPGGNVPKSPAMDFAQSPMIGGQEEHHYFTMGQPMQLPPSSSQPFFPGNPFMGRPYPMPQQLHMFPQPGTQEYAA